MKASIASLQADGSAVRYRLEPFEPAPVECGASGLAILAFLPEQTGSRIRAAAGAGDRKNLSGVALTAQVEAVHRTGYAFSKGQKLPDSVGIAVPVRVAEGAPVGSLTVTIPESRFVEERLEDYVALLVEEARVLSGGQGA